MCKLIKRVKLHTCDSEVYTYESATSNREQKRKVVKGVKVVEVVEFVQHKTCERVD